ncbi:molybdenum cofactor guanylyltransferase [Comamonas sp. BIGb0124]|uniref:molybdenum cofactor guanylyltransferase n=1 Tax=Comamonas sp. BIGb0124 TaxID=2485130 RepID=UPI000F46509F|nr:molybdenum cofactor guanylyltransferase [Comamonas sp. BIGb0124]ROR18132.1 molybdenum cofactor guanylyltransferase [Comamonas sp. BIGb0124]
MSLTASCPPPAAPSVTRQTDVTGVILAGGEGRRMGGLDKGLQPLHGQALARHCATRLAPQVAVLALNANRHLDQYAAWGWPVWPDARVQAASPASRPSAPESRSSEPPPRHDGPLAGLLTALSHAATPLVQVAACDTPLFPHDLVATLHRALHEAEADIALPCTRDADGRTWQHPTFALLRTALCPSLQAYLAAGDRQMMRWLASHRHVQVELPHDAFRNFNTLADLQAYADRT